MLKLLSKVNIVISSGTLIEWAEFTYFSYIADKISLVFFPLLNHNLALLFTFTVFAISYITRPLGGVIFGIIGDKYGRKLSMYYSLIIMGSVTCAIGFIPGYTSLGIISPLLLVFFRLIQGFALAGEFCGSAIYLLETNPHKPYTSSSLTSIFSATGMFIGSLLAVIISLPNMPSWAWRLPFIIGGCICILATYARRNLPESIDFTILKDTNSLTKQPLKELITFHKIALIQTFLLASFMGIYIYICNIWWISYMLQTKHLNALNSKIYASSAQALVILFILLLAPIAEKLNNRWLLRIGLLLAIIASYLLFNSKVNSSIQLSFAIVIYALANAAVSSTMFKYMADIFPIKLRASGQSSMWNIAIAILGGTAPLIAQSLYNYTINYVFMYICIIITLTYLSSFFKTQK